jgi:hypothetical protein
MESLALRPRKATEIIDAAIEVYRRNPIHFLLLAAIVRVPWLIVQIIFVPAQDGDIEALIPAMLISAGSAITTFLMGGFIVHMASELYLGRETDAFDTIRKVLPRIASVFAASLMQSFLLGLGLVLFLFPAVWVAAVCFAVIPVIVIEKRGVFGAFSRSLQLSDRVKGHVLSALGLVVLIRIIVEVGIAVISFAIPMIELRYVAATAASMVIYPLLGISVTLIYYDVRIRKEGFDIEMMAQQAPEPSPATV